MDRDGVIGPYRLIEQLGHDGMGVVYRARHALSEQAVALKTVKVSAPRWLGHIRREIHALSRVHHPGLVRIRDHGVHEGLPWYAMDLLEGEKLSHFINRTWSPYDRPRVARGMTQPITATKAVTGNERLAETKPFRPPEPLANGPPPAAAGQLPLVLEMMRRVCATLAFLHGEGFIHRDLKPGNIMLVDGEPILFDLGLAAHHSGGTGREEIDSQDARLGTIPYMSPEQIRGEFVDARSDLYAIGCILYELVAKTPPFWRALEHLTRDPEPPSTRVADLPPSLDAVIKKLLAKSVTERFGYADEVAAILAEIGAEVSGERARPLDWPPPRPYLYRPAFVGRSQIVSRLSELRNEAAAGAGAFALIGGESGVGKTRVAMEVTRFGSSQRMQVVTSEATSLSIDRSTAVGSAPLQAVRPLLRAVADRCQELGPEATERIVGHRRSVLAVYEPLLTQVPAGGSLPPPPALRPDASRQRLLAYLAEVLANYSAEEPLLWVIDDVGWADELSLAFLQSLSPDFFGTNRVFILGTYRSEEATEGVRKLAARPGVFHTLLTRLDQSAVRSIVSDTLALASPWEEFVEYVCAQAEGNPFFVVEYLRAAVAERLIFRDRRQTWKLRIEGKAAATELAALRLPRSLLELLERRLGALSGPAQRAAAAAAVLGREADAETLAEVAALSQSVAQLSVDELVDRQVFEEPPESTVRFAHDKLREVAYSRTPSRELLDLHGRAGFALERRYKANADASQHWAAIGYHFGTARIADEAALYLHKAADHARATHANADAIRLYGEAIEQMDHVLARLDPSADAGGGVGGVAVRIELSEARADVLALTGQRDEARASYTQALSQVAETAPATRARLHRKLGKTWELQHDHTNALACYDQAESILRGDAPDAPEAEREEWIQVLIEKQWLHYWRADMPAMDAIVAELAPVIGTFGAPLQQVRYFVSLVLRNLRRDRFVSSEETLRHARNAVEACPPKARLTELPLARFVLGFTLLFQGFHGSFEAAEQELRAAAALADRAGDVALLARCYTYLSVAARMQHNHVDTAAFADHTTRAATASSQREYIAAARAQSAWLAARDASHDEAIRLGHEALATWAELPLVFPFRWLALVPVLDASLKTGDLARAIAAAASLMEPTQQLLPGQAVDAMARASRLFRAGETDAAAAQLRTALLHLEEQRFH